MNKFFTQYFSDEDGATAIEYGLIAAGIGLTIIATVSAIGVDLGAVFADISANL
ncbi:MAG: Flp family type IVb pilin [Alphaproteobacteria bacterium]|nr:MAG: Flp family type IVb pilin [Alphaproteobacteria bacterium]